MRYLFVVLSACILTSCNHNSTISLTGKIKGIPDGTTLYIQKVGENDQPVTTDTLTVTDGGFAIEMEKPQHTEIALLNFKNLGTSMLFFIEDENIVATINVFDNKAFFEGGRENALFNEYKRNIYDFYEKKYQVELDMQQAQENQNIEEYTKIKVQGAQIINDEKSYKKSFVENNANTMVGMMALHELIGKREITLPDAQAILAKRNQKLPDNIYTRLITKSISSLSGAEIGNLAPDFSGPTPDGGTLSLNEVVGKSKLTLIDFWASWCRPCRVENPNVVRVHNKYKDMGFNIVSVSLDRPNARQRWLEAIKTDQMNWYHISHLQHWNEPIARQYNVRSIPATFLVDENGVIIAKNLRGDALERVVGENISK